MGALKKRINKNLVLNKLEEPIALTHEHKNEVMGLKEKKCFSIMKYDILSFHCSPLTFGIMNHARKNKFWNRKGLQNVSGCVDKGIKNYSLRHLLQYLSVNRFRKLAKSWRACMPLYKWISIQRWQYQIHKSFVDIIVVFLICIVF